MSRVYMMLSKRLSAISESTESFTSYIARKHTFFLQLSLAIALLGLGWEPLLQKALNVIQLLQASRVSHAPEALLLASTQEILKRQNVKNKKLTDTS